MVKALLWVACIVLSLFSAMHLFVAMEHMRQVPQRESVLLPLLIAAVSAGLALLAYRFASRGGSPG